MQPFALSVLALLGCPCKTTEDPVSPQDRAAEFALPEADVVFSARSLGSLGEIMLHKTMAFAVSDLNPVRYAYQIQRDVAKMQPSVDLMKLPFLPVFPPVPEAAVKVEPVQEPTGILAVDAALQLNTEFNDVVIVLQQLVLVIGSDWDCHGARGCVTRQGIMSTFGLRMGGSLAYHGPQPARICVFLRLRPVSTGDLEMLRGRTHSFMRWVLDRRYYSLCSGYSGTARSDVWNALPG